MPALEATGLRRRREAARAAVIVGANKNTQAIWRQA
jgi:hypothetical protein